MRFRVITIAKLNKESALAYVSGDTFQLESLETSPSEESVVCRCEFTEVPRNVFVDVTVGGVGSSLVELRNCVLADGLV